MHNMWLFDIRWTTESEMDGYHKQQLDHIMKPFDAVKNQYNVQYNFCIDRDLESESLKCVVVAKFAYKEDAMLFKLKHMDLLNELR